jgi:hypothetical protein
LTEDAFFRYRDLFQAILNRTANPEAPDLQDVFCDWDARTLRRSVSTLNELLRERCHADGLLYHLSVCESRPGYQSPEQRRQRSTFRLVPFLTKDFNLKRFWQSLFPGKPGGAKAKSVDLVYSTTFRANEPRHACLVGDFLFVNRLSSMFWRHGIEARLCEAGSYSGYPNENLQDIIVVDSLGGEGNAFIAGIEEQRTWRLKGEYIVSALHRAATYLAGGDKVESPHVHVLVSRARCSWSLRTTYLFETAHPRAMEAVGAWFTDPACMIELAAMIGLDPLDTYPTPFQIVLRVPLNRNGEPVAGGIRVMEIAAPNSSLSNRAVKPSSTARERAAESLRPSMNKFA